MFYTSIEVHFATNVVVIHFQFVTDVVSGHTCESIARKHTHTQNNIVSVAINPPVADRLNVVARRGDVKP